MERKRDAKPRLILEQKVRETSAMDIRRLRATLVSERQKSSRPRERERETHTMLVVYK